jgi:ribose transport system ATP-binding protein
MRGVKKRFGATVALDGVELAVAAGEVHALVGENGAGKSTLMKVLSGAERADAGEMKLGDKQFAPQDPLEARRAGVAMIYQELSLADRLSVEENIMLGMEPGRFGLVRAKEARARAAEALSVLGHSEINPRTRVGRLSISSRQIVEIARALAVGCRVLVLDEPTSALSGPDAERLFECVRRLKDQGRAIVYISHFIEEVTRIADRFTVLRDGKVAGAGAIADTSADEIVGMMVGRKIERMYPRSARAPGEEVLAVEGLAGQVKPGSVSLVLKRGEVLGIAGLVGAGRTELLRAVFGLDPVKRGRIKVGAYIGPASPARRWAQGVGLLSEDRKGEGLAVNMSLADNVTLSRLSGLGPLGLVLPSRQDAAVRRQVVDLSIRCRGPRQKVAELSGGNQQKAALARLLHHDVDVLLLDEPTRGIDVASKARIYELIDELAAGAGGRPRAVLMVSGYLPELLGVCDRIAVMCRGRLGTARPARELSQHRLMMEATGQGETDGTGPG